MYAVKDDKSDVCVYYSYDGKLVCGECSLNNERYSEFDSTADCVHHLYRHMVEGHRMPDDIIKEIEGDERENFWWKYVQSDLEGYELYGEDYDDRFYDEDEWE